MADALISGRITPPGSNRAVMCEVRAIPQTEGEAVPLADRYVLGPTEPVTTTADGSFTGLPVPIVAGVLWRIQAKPVGDTQVHDTWDVGLFPVTASGTLHGDLKPVPALTATDPTIVVNALTAAADAQSARTAAQTARAGAETARAAAEARVDFLSAPANEQVAGYITNPGAAQNALLATSARAANERARLDAIGRSDNAASAGGHRYQWDETPVVTEEWANKAAWSAADPTVTDGVLYAASGSAPGMVRPYTVPDGARARVRSTIIVNNGPTGAAFGSLLCLVGLSNGTAGAAPTGSKLYAIGVDPGTNRPVFWRGVDLGGANSPVQLSATALPVGIYDVTVVVDELSVSLSLSNLAGTVDYVTTMARTNLPGIKNMAVFTSGVTAGLGVGRIAARAGSPTIFPRRSANAVAALLSLSKDWTDFTGWVQSSTQLSGGKVFHDATVGGGTAVAVARAVNVAGMDTLNLSVPLSVPAAGGGTGYAMLALSVASAVSATPSSAGLIAIGVQSNTGKMVRFTGATAGGTGAFVASAAAAQTGTHTVTITSDATNYILTVTAPDGTTTYSYTVARSVGAVKQVLLYQSDPRDLSGIGIGSLTGGITYLQAPSGQYEGATNTVAYIKPTAASTSLMRLAVPASYDSRRPRPLVIYTHGHGRDALTGPNESAFSQSVWQQVTAAGYLFASADAQGGITWGNPASVDDYENVYRYARDHYAISGVVLIAQSMGGLPALNMIARRNIPNILGFYGIAPVCSLRAIYDADWNGDFRAEVKTTYGIAANGSDYDAKTAGSDPMLRPAEDFRGIPVRMALPTDDDVVPPTSHGLPFLAKLAGRTPEASNFQLPGGHIVSGAFNVADMTAFLARATAA